ncbi:competence/damage-inducible protein A [Mucilaginibacter achroorhodeus]|uniref:CinA-like protein n=1 Tax=Mucilaginibacter achroorhodeus TaxID=2599294 RepID=A0A563U413_9SPHI|nr:MULTISPECIES: competence/damage-inducible protein A [Mucilaginibacter]QXV64434.1 competence/damage-inducible protein A [Mucilaginibacter sp. 21P]TWR26080.1 competence/damage-inducible protein A [Mucilaginibacter achroorhodeus]
MLAEIITIGDEILIGQIVDTNSAWMAQLLNSEGIRVKQISSVSDNREHILKAFAEAAERVDIILITGGLGPTKDDITKQTLAQYFGVPLVLNEDALTNVLNIFKRYNRPMLDVNRMQAQVPQNCEVILNHNGTAPGMWFNEDGKIYVSMPGVPFEMQYMMQDQVVPKLKQTLKLPSIVHKTILTAGEGESYLAEKISDIESSLPPHIKLAYLPKMGQVRLRLSGDGEDEAALKKEIDVFAAQIVERVGVNVIAQEDKPIEKVILDEMASRGLTLSLAESCTGGYVSHLLTQHAGSSAVYLGGLVSYANDLKQHILGVKEETLYQFGAVSEQTVIEMVEGALRQFKSDYAVAITGIAGPGGGSEEKPVGTVWIAVANANKTVTKKFTFGNKRLQNIERSAVSAFFMLNTLIKETTT